MTHVRDDWEIKTEPAGGLQWRAGEGGFDVAPFDGVRVRFRKAGTCARWRSFILVAPLPRGALSARSLQRTVTRFVRGQVS